MEKADCMVCNNRIHRPYPYSRSFMGICAFDMRRASTAGGSAPDDMQDVCWCGDYDQENDADQQESQ